MAIKKVFVDADAELEAYLHQDKTQCVITIRQCEDYSTIFLDSEDIIELISELQSIKNQIDK